MTPEDRARLFEPGDLTDDDLFAVMGRTAGAPVTTPTMSKSQVREWLSISSNDLKIATTRQTIRRVSPGRYLTASVVRHLPGVAVANLAQTCAVLDRSPSWLRRELGRLGLVADPVGSTYRFSKVSVNKVAAGLRRVDDARQERAAIRELDTVARRAARQAARTTTSKGH